MSDPLKKLGPISESAIANVEKIEAKDRRERERRGHHASFEAAADKSMKAEVGGTTEKLTWGAYVKKVWKGPWTTGATFKW